MTDIAMTVELLGKPTSSQWQKLKPLVEEAAAQLGHRTYEFHTYSDGCMFLALCDEFDIKYLATVGD
ncbi:hypothetical protein [Aeromonas schubertii]|uniref:Uncharacterized protein n=1 Tax=Aeromonas schubertii TaxID=652 RepID=A0A0S2SNX5_9GAMM|nr:hypothetical protein [Aeromonas schubertii]ALP43409.1 hypothetical protein WL1483_3990 [Aeromonas schubertii]